MKINKCILKASVLLCMAFFALGAQAQEVKLKMFEWNILSFERPDKSGERAGFPIADFIALIKKSDPDVICLNEFETNTARMEKEKLTECAQQLGMYPFFGFSYVKESGCYGNGILSKYPIVNSASKTLGRYNTYSYANDIRSVEFVDILVPTASKPEGVKVRIVATHIETFCDSYTQVMQVKEVIEFAINPAIEANIPCLIMGDMNCSPYSEAIAEYETVGTRLCNNNGTFMASSKLDYLISFPKNKWSCSDYKVIQEGYYDNLSDHCPIFGTAELK